MEVFQFSVEVKPNHNETFSVNTGIATFVTVVPRIGEVFDVKLKMTDFVDVASTKQFSLEI